MPLLLLAGLAVVTTGRGSRWLVAWIVTVATGLAFKCATLSFLLPCFMREMHSSATGTGRCLPGEAASTRGVAATSTSSARGPDRVLRQEGHE